MFAEKQGSFLVGSIAAQASKTGNVGFIGGVNVPLIQKFEAGFEAGAKAVNPDIKVQVKYLTEPPDFSGFGDPAKGETAAQGMYDRRCRRRLPAAGGSGGGVFKAAKAAARRGRSVSTPTSTTSRRSTPSRTSSSPRCSSASTWRCYDFIKSCRRRAPCLTGVQTFDLEKDGVGYSKSNPAVEPYEAKTDELAAQIIAGTITVSRQAVTACAVRTQTGPVRAR